MEHMDLYWEKIMITKNNLIENFKNLGIEEGDTVFIRGNLGKVGRLKKRDIFLESLLEVIGENGTIVTLGFTKSFLFYKLDKNFIFNRNTESTTGGLSKLFMRHVDCKRSEHPTNSFLAIGKNAKYILEGHNENSLSYDPMKRVIELNSKMIIFGIIKESPGFTTVHFAQQELGLTKKSFASGLLRVYYTKKGIKKLFIRRDIGGCSLGFDKFYKYYLDQNILKLGQVGNSQAISVDAQSAYEIEYNLIQKNNSFHFCDDPLCLSCRASWKYDIKYLPNFIIMKAFNYIFKGKK